MVDDAIEKNQISGLLLICYENERPLDGMIAHLDWRFDGAFSRLIQKQILTGAPGESIYQPLKWNEHTYHFVIFGGGFRKDTMSRVEQSKTLFARALLKLDELKLEKMALSAQDWDVDSKKVELEKRGLCILQ